MFSKGRESGMGIIELIIYSALSLLVLAAVGGLLVTILRVQDDVVNGSQSASESQVIAQNIETGIRNATAFQVTDLSSGRQLLMARTSGTAPTISWLCSAWLFDPSNGGEVRQVQKTSTISPPTTLESQSWTLLGIGISVATPAKMFTASGQSLNFGFSAKVGSEAPVNVKTSVTARGGRAVSSPCF